jgi:AraC family transcriptional regulator of adaptative response / DNA-3-methyladenine glycosylase II
MQSLNPETCRRARLARDPRFDGEFFLAVTTTGIYCRPICPARPPRENNVRYYRTAAEAASSGFRPCLRCRPESAPDSPAWRGTSTTVNRALQLINQGALNRGSLGELAERLGVGERYLRKLFTAQLGASPSAVAHTRRLHFAQKLLRETSLGMTDIAYASGYGSVRRFNSAVRDQFSCSPSELRERGQKRSNRSDGIRLELNYRPPLDWQALLDFFGRHAIEGIEQVTGERYHRSFCLNGRCGHFTVGPGRRQNSLVLDVELDDTGELMEVVARVRRMLDLDANPDELSQGLASDALLQPLLARAPGVRSPVQFSVFESCVRAIVGQQISLQAARNVLGRITAACREQHTVLDSAGFPTPAQIAALPDSALPMPGARRNTLRAACALFERGPDGQQQTCDELLKLKGVGPWTIQMLQMRGFGDPDVFPHKDLGLLKALSALGLESNRDLLPHIEQWRPWGSYAANLLWRSLA